MCSAAARRSCLYSLFANTVQVYNDTNPMTSGTGSTNVTASGWVAGAGIEYAVTNNWTTSFEYDRIDVGSVGVAFPTVVPVNTHNISVRQTLDVFKKSPVKLTTAESRQ